MVWWAGVYLACAVLGYLGTDAVLRRRRRRFLRVSIKGRDGVVRRGQLDAWLDPDVQRLIDAIH